MRSATVEIGVSNMDFYPFALPGSDAPTWRSDVDGMVSFLEQTNARSVEVFPTANIVADVQNRIDKGLTAGVDEIIGSQHMTFNNGRGLYGRVADKCGVLREDNCIGGMAVIQAALPENAPAVMYHDRAPEGGYTDENTGLKLRIAQPQPEDYPQLQKEFPDIDVRSPEGFREALRRKGIVGLCMDTGHSRRLGTVGDGGAGPYAAPYWQDVWPDQFASGKVYELHASANRVDQAKNDPEFAANSAAEYKALTSRSWRAARDTEMGEMIISGIEHWVPPADLARPVLRMIMEFPPDPRRIRRSIAEHAQAVVNLAEIVRYAGGRPLLWDSPNSQRPYSQ